MHPTRKDELELCLGDMVNHASRESNTCDVQLRTDVQVRQIPGTMHLEIDLMYCDIWSESFQSDEFTIKLATCKQLIENASVQYRAQSSNLITQIITSTMSALET